MNEVFTTRRIRMNHVRLGDEACGTQHFEDRGYVAPKQSVNNGIPKGGVYYIEDEACGTQGFSGRNYDGGKND
ncbi:MAG: hypothetical protein KJ592_03555 [Nanoarchaeota archaeon]|nr:hypothetical protein [Nanoarchaeota archaeon]